MKMEEEEELQKQLELARDANLPTAAAIADLLLLLPPPPPPPSHVHPIHPNNTFSPPNPPVANAPSSTLMISASTSMCMFATPDC